jgi:hypothetical protein
MNGLELIATTVLCTLSLAAWVMQNVAVSAGISRQYRRAKRASRRARRALYRCCGKVPRRRATVTPLRTSTTAPRTYQTPIEIVTQDTHDTQPRVRDAPINIPTIKEQTEDSSRSIEVVVHTTAPSNQATPPEKKRGNVLSRSWWFILSKFGLRPRSQTKQQSKVKPKLSVITNRSWLQRNPSTLWREPSKREESEVNKRNIHTMSLRHDVDVKQRRRDAAFTKLMFAKDAYRDVARGRTNSDFESTMRELTQDQVCLCELDYGRHVKQYQYAKRRLDDHVLRLQESNA